MLNTYTKPSTLTVIVRRDFLLSFLSGNSLTHYPEYTPTNLTTKLHEVVDLPGERERSAVEIPFPQTYYNIEDEELVITKTLTLIKFSVAGGSYRSISKSAEGETHKITVTTGKYILPR